METQNSYKEDVVEIDLKELFIRLIEKAWQIILVAIIVAALLGGFKFVKSYKDYRAFQQEQMQESASDTEDAVKLYETQKTAYEERLEALQNFILRQQQYMSESTLMNIDVDNFYEATLSYYITTNYQIDPELSMQNPDKTQSVINSYRALLTSGEFYQFVGERVSESIAPKYLQELITISNGDNGILNITIVDSSITRVQEVMEALEQFMEEQQSKVESLVAEHELSLLYASVYNSQNADEMEGANAGSQQAQILQKQLDASNTINNYQNQITDVQKKLDALAEPSEAVTSKKDVLKDGVKFAIIGFVLGGFLSVAYYALIFILSNPVVDEETVTRRLGLVVLGSEKRFNKKGILNRINMILSGDKERQENLEQTCSFAAENIKAMLQSGDSAESILFLGSIASDTQVVVENIKTQMNGVSVSSVGDILTDENAVKDLKDATDLVLVEKKGAVSYERIHKEIRKLQLLKKNIRGIILL